MFESMWMVVVFVTIEVLLSRAYDLGFIAGAFSGVARQRWRRFAHRDSSSRAIELVELRRLPMASEFYSPSLLRVTIEAPAAPPALPR